MQGSTFSDTYTGSSAMLIADSTMRFGKAFHVTGTSYSAANAKLSRCFEYNHDTGFLIDGDTLWTELDGCSSDGNPALLDPNTVSVSLQGNANAVLWRGGYLGSHAYSIIAASTAPGAASFVGTAFGTDTLGQIQATSGGLTLVGCAMYGDTITVANTMTSLAIVGCPGGATLSFAGAAAKAVTTVLASPGVNGNGSQVPTPIQMAAGGIIQDTIALGITASGSTQGTATSVTTTIGVVTGAASADLGVRIDAAGIGAMYELWNFSTYPIIAYPPGSYSFNNGTVNVGITVPPGDVFRARCVSETQFYACIVPAASGYAALNIAGPLTLTGSLGALSVAGSRGCVERDCRVRRAAYQRLRSGNGPRLAQRHHPDDRVRIRI